MDRWNSSLIPQNGLSRRHCVHNSSLQHRRDYSRSGNVLTMMRDDYFVDMKVIQNLVSALCKYTAVDQMLRVSLTSRVRAPWYISRYLRFLSHCSFRPSLFLRDLCRAVQYFFCEASINELGRTRINQRGDIIGASAWITSATTAWPCRARAAMHRFLAGDYDNGRPLCQVEHCKH
jgi:hypothetical protein